MMAVVAQTLQLGMKNVLTYSLGSIPWSLATSNGSLRKTNKAAFSTFLEKLSPPTECLPDNTTCIIDAMSIVQKRKCNQKTFSEMTELLFSSFLMESGQCQRIDIIFYVYQDKSIKNVERFDKRDAASATAFKSILGSRKVKQWQSFIKGSINKIEFIRFMYKEWRKLHYRSKLMNGRMYLAYEQEFWLMTRDSVTEIRLSIF